MAHARTRIAWRLAFVISAMLPAGTLLAAESPELAARSKRAKMLLDYFEAMSAPKPQVIRTGEDWQSHRRRLQESLMASIGLSPLPERSPLDVHLSPALDHPWCTVHRVHYQLWPGVYSSGLLFMPKQFREKPAPAILNPHGHWENGNAHPEVQRRCLNMARLGYVTFSSSQNHYEDLPVGVSHQTLMVWNNMRALDYLQSLPEVDKSRIGAAGCSGGGLQAQMIVALDPRVKAASIVGLTCDFREIMFPDSSHCTCNHFPGVMRFTDHPEISTLGLPAAVQYLTMNDWTQTFEKKNFPTIQKLYAAHGLADHVDCKYYSTDHSYDKQKRERTYWWMERWLRGRNVPAPESEPETKVFPVDTILKLAASVPNDKGFTEISRIYREQRGYKPPVLASREDLGKYQERMTASLKDLLGESTVLPRRPAQPARPQEVKEENGLLVERAEYPSEHGILVPAIVLRAKNATGRLPVKILLSGAGKESLLAETGENSARELARRGSLVVLPDVRGFGEMLSTGTNNVNAQRLAWERNGIVWGRPLTGMGCTDLRGALDGLASRADAAPSRIELIARKSGDAAIVALVTAALDQRISSVDADLAGGCFEKRNVSLVTNVLQHGDVLQWAALVVPRKVVLRNVPKEAGDLAWLAMVAELAGDRQSVRMEAAEPLVYERFEKATSGKIEGGVRFESDVVGFGGLAMPNQSSAVFDGQRGTSVNLGSAKKIASTGFTIEAFVKLADCSACQVLASDWNEIADNRAWALTVLPGGALRFDVSPDGKFYPDNRLMTARRVMEPNRWYHVAAVSEGDTSRIYVNGREVARQVRPHSGIFVRGNGNLRIGSADLFGTEGPQPLHGWLDEVRISVRPLQPSEFIKTKDAMPEAAVSPVPTKYEMPFVAKTKAEAEAWQKAARARLMELVEKQRPRVSTADVPIDLKIEAREDRGAYTLHRVSFQGNNREGTRYPGLLAIPKGKGPFPAMLAIHGHGGAAEAVFDPQGLYKGMADRFARNGYVVLAPSFPHQRFAATMLWDLFRCVDILASRPEVDAARIGVGGLSMGGEWTMWIAACDLRLKVAVVSGWMCTTEGVFSVPNCECWELPGFVELMDVCEVNLLIAPREVVFESAEQDGCFPIECTRQGFARIQGGYRLFGKEGAVVQDTWPAGHEWHGPVAYKIVDQVLKPASN